MAKNTPLPTASPPVPGSGPTFKNRTEILLSDTQAQKLNEAINAVRQTRPRTSVADLIRYVIDKFLGKAVQDLK